jgi:hypothetical protein
VIRAGCIVTGIQCAWFGAAVLGFSAGNGSSIGASAAATPLLRAPLAHEVSREEATAMLHARYGSQARVVRADEMDQNGHRVYVFRLLSVNGRIWIVRIDAQSGAELP